LKGVRLIRRVYFSSGHRYWLPSLTEAENRRLFGAWASPYNHGHNYVLDVAIEGSVDASTGMVINIKDLDEVVRSHVVSEFDGKSINDEIPHFQDRPPSLENIVLYIRDRIEAALPSSVRLTSLRLEETPALWITLEQGEKQWNMNLTRTYEFAASHRLHCPDLSDAMNYEMFGKCNNPAGHGHNYVLEVTVSGQFDPQTGMMCDLTELDRIVHEEVVDRYDHKNLNEDLPEFKGRVTTSEIVTQEIWNRLERALPVKLVRVRLGETARSFFEVEAA
jgi:6-pyruvoyltetrahydropterin/6-carboxytetrahydropterin synthase